MRTILSKNGQKHDYMTLVSLFAELEPNQIKDIIITLGLQGILNDDGEFAPTYSLDILSSTDRFLVPDTNNQITLRGKLYNYFAEVTDVTGVVWKWTRNSGTSGDSVWIKDTQVIDITDQDLTSSFKDRDITFTLEATLPTSEVITDTFTFSSVLTYSSVQLKASNTLFMPDNSIPSIDFRAVYKNMNVESFAWYVNEQLVGSNIGFTLHSSQVAEGSFAEVKLEVIDTKGNSYTDNITIPKIKNGNNGQDAGSGYVIDLSNENQSIPTNSSGVITGNTALNGASTEIKFFYGDDEVPLTDYELQYSASHVGIDYSVFPGTDNVTTTLRVTSYNTPNDSDYIDVKALIDGVVVRTARFSLVKAKGIATYSIVPSINSLKIQGTTVIPAAISAKVLKNTGTEVVETSEGTLAYRYSYSGGDGNAILPGALINLSAAGNPNHIEFLFYHPINNTLVDRETIPFVRDGQNGEQGPTGPAGPQGSPGVPGTDAPIVRRVEWVEGQTYYNTTTVRDYVYHRPTLKTYKLRAGVAQKVATGEPTDSSDWLLTTEVQDTVISENANIGGWIMRNDMFFSQMGLFTDPVTGEMLYSNAVLNGGTGDLIFGNNEAKLNRRGLIFKDDVGRERLVLLRDGGDGVPVIRMLNADGSVYWEAGPQNFGIITQGTTQPSWGYDMGVRLIDNLANDSELVFSNFVKNQVASFVRTFLNKQPNRPSSASLTGSDAAYFTTGAFPTTYVYGYGSNTFGYVNKLSKGDIIANQDLIEGYYTYRQGVRPSDLPSSYLLPDGWYIMQGISGDNGAELDAYINTPGEYNYNVAVIYIKNGVSYREESVTVHTQDI